MRYRALILAAVALSVVGSTVGPAAQAADGDCRLIRGANTPDITTDDVQVCRSDVWIHKADNPVGNLGESLPSWNKTKPTGTLATGGFYYPFRLADIADPNNPDYRPTFEGKFTGPIDTLAADFYVKLPLYEALLPVWPLITRLRIDGEVVFEQSDPEIDVPMTAAGDFKRIQFVFTNLYETMKTLGLDLSPTKEHTVELNFIQLYWGDGAPAGVFYDAADVASGLIFNLEPTQMKGYTKIDTLPPA